MKLKMTVLMTNKTRSYEKSLNWTTNAIPCQDVSIQKNVAVVLPNRFNHWRVRFQRFVTSRSGKEVKVWTKVGSIY